MSEELPHISVCVCAYKRPQLLERGLREIGRQETGGLFGFSIVVADNDKAQSGQPVALKAAAQAPVPIYYVLEPEQNIALARNKALENARGDYVAFIDDDEFPERDWLLTLFKACRRYEADGVLGPVKPHFEQEPPAWVKKGKFFDRPAHETGFWIDWTEGRTGNLLLRKEILAGVEPVFRPEFGSGGEDRNFFMRMMQKGCRFVWCDEAVAYELVPSARWKAGVMLRRALLRGKMSLHHQNFGMGELAKSAVALPLYCLALPFLLLFGYHRFLSCLIRTFDHAGRILAFLGFNPVKEVYVTD